MMGAPGQCNSSITRVRPVFQALMQRDPTGADWLPRLLGLAGHECELAANLASDPGVLLPSVTEKRCYKDPVLRRKPYNIPGIWLEVCFEKRTHPPARFLRWLVRHPDHMTWPESGKGRRRRFGARTQRLREELFGYHGPEAQNNAMTMALDALESRGAARSWRKWWAFEGYTDVDCWLETDQLLLFVEGKRTEPISESIDFYPHRNQVLRNLEAAAEHCSEKEYAVMVIAEEALADPSPQEIELGLPHLSSLERGEMMRHYLGCVLWEDVCQATGIEYQSLPRRTGDIVDRLRGSRC